MEWMDIWMDLPPLRFFVKDLKLTREMFLKNFVTVGGLMTGAVGVLSRIY